MLRDYFQYAWVSISKRKLRAYLTLIGIFIGIATVVSLISLGDGLRNAITLQFALLDADKLSINAAGTGRGPPGTGVINPLKKEYRDKIARVSGVNEVTGRIIRPVKMEFNNKVEFKFLGSVSEGSQRDMLERAVNLEIDKGRLLRDGDRRKVVVGAEFASSDNAFGKSVSVGDRVLLQDQEFEVVGILKRKGSFIIDDTVMMNEDLMRDLYGVKDTYDGIIVEVRNIEEIGKVQEDIERLLRKERKVRVGEEDFTVQTAAASLRQLDAVLVGVQAFFVFIALISLVVGGIGIMNTMYTSVLERTKEIGIMKSVGAKNSAIFTLFFIESGFFGMIGGSIGIVVGIALAKLLAFIGSQALGSDLIQAKVGVYLIPLALLFSFLVGVLSGTMPAYQASKLKPVDALRFAK